MFSLTTQSIARINSQTLSSSSTKKVNAPSRARRAFLNALVEPSSSIDDAEILEKSLDAPAASKEIPRPRKAMIDPADGSISEAAPLGNDTQLLDDALSVFKSATAIEMINGRVAQIGWMAALYNEITTGKSLWGQVFSTRTFTLADGVSDTVTYPGAGLFLAPFVAVVILGASLAPVLKKSKPDGVTAPGETFAMFNPAAELTNGRGAMVGLAALLLAEKFTSGSALL